jgi:hypothetical protein
MTADFDDKEVEARKRAVFEAMSPRRQSFILKKGYDLWDPFQEPKDPIDIRRDKSKRTTQMLVREFLNTRQRSDESYNRGVLDIALGIVNRDDYYLGMYEFSCWYRTLLVREGHEKER